jgi:hypothetical protein
MPSVAGCGGNGGHGETGTAVNRWWKAAMEGQAGPARAVSRMVHRVLEATEVTVAGVDAAAMAQTAETAEMPVTSRFSTRPEDRFLISRLKERML